jgi:hypothetical protein
MEVRALSLCIRTLLERHVDRKDEFDTLFALLEKQNVGAGI